MMVIGFIYNHYSARNLVSDGFIPIEVFPAEAKGIRMHHRTRPSERPRRRNQRMVRIGEDPLQARSRCRD